MTMDQLNRSAAIVKPLPPYLEWARAGDAEGLAESVFESLREGEPHIYLLPEYVYLSERKELLDAFWPAIFDRMLEGWVTDEALWPTDRTRQMFDEWFEVQMTSVIEDLDVYEPLEVT